MIIFILLLMLSELTDIEHVIKCPDVYMGNSNDVCENVIQYNPESGTLFREKLNYNSGILKMFDEILLNAIDNIERDTGLSFIKVGISRREISVMNDGESKELIIKKKKANSGEDVWIPEMAFTRLRTSGNYTVKNKLTGGKNGIGCKLTSIFSKMFSVDLVSNGQRYTQVYRNNIHLIEPPKITSCDEESSIKITFEPDFKLLNTEPEILWEMRYLLARRLFDLSHLEVKLFIDFDSNENFEELDPKTIEEFTIDACSWNDFVSAHKIMFNEKISNIVEFYDYSKEWKIAFSISDSFRQVSYVNNIATYDGGTHVNYILNQLCEGILKLIPAKSKKTLSATKVKGKLCVFIYAKIVNPSFKSQAKEYLSTPMKNFNFVIPQSLIKEFVSETPIIDMILNDKLPKTKITRGLITNIPNLIEANKAGGKFGPQCTLFVCEGMSARTMCVRGINVIGPDFYGVYPLGGKILNVRNCSNDVYGKNNVLTELKRIIGLEDGKIYENVEGLRYGKVVCVKDADTDGANIMGLLINFFDVKFPSLLRIPGFFSTFMSPMIRIKFKNNGSGSKKSKKNKNKGTTLDDSEPKNVLSFYNEVDYKNYITENPLPVGAKVIFIKGLATNEDDDIEDMFKNYEKNTIPIDFDNPELLVHTFDSACIDKRKELLTTINDETHLDVIENEPILLSNFINLDHSLYERDACERAIPSVIDGLKPTQRKVLYVLFKYPRKQMKVFQVSGIVAQQANYHHGDQSMSATIIKMAQDFTGANNINYLTPIGQFGSRLANGDDAGAPRYISTVINPISRLIFPAIDDNVLKEKHEDNQIVEPYFYIPIIPMILANEVRGIGMGWSTTIPAFNPLDLIEITREWILTREIRDSIMSFHRYFKGPIERIENGFTYNGIVTRECARKFVISEIPIGMKINDLLKRLNFLMSNKSVVDSNEFPKSVQFKPIYKINNFKMLKTKNKNDVSISVTFVEDLKISEVIETLKLKSSILTTNITAFNRKGEIRRYTIGGLLSEFFVVRHNAYVKRQKYMISVLNQEIKTLSNKFRFIKEVIEKKIIINNIPIKKVCEQLENGNYDKIYNSSPNGSKSKNPTSIEDTEMIESDVIEIVQTTGTGFEYLYQMKISKFTHEEYEKLRKQMESKIIEKEEVEKMRVADMWLHDLEVLKNELLK
jgi:DNA topoisomerase-2